MNTETRINLAADIVKHARSHGITEYVDNIIEPNAAVAAQYYGVTVADLLETAHQIARGLDGNGFIFVGGAA